MYDCSLSQNIYTDVTVTPWSCQHRWALRPQQLQLATRALGQAVASHFKGTAPARRPAVARREGWPWRDSSAPL